MGPESSSETLLSI